MSDVVDELTIGPHLLGRKPFVADDRDFELRHWVEHDSALEAALAQLQSSHAAAATKVWAAVATKAIEALQPAPPPAPQPAGDVDWSDPDAPLDQGNFGTCVGHGTAQFLNTDPVEDHYEEGMSEPATTGLPTARALYYEATVLDGKPDDPDAAGGGQQGATVRSGMKALANRKRISSYATAASTDEITAWIRAKGPVVVGTDWTADMFTPDVEGFVHPTGGVAGGHCWLIVGISADGSSYHALNSWGSGWGVGGYFRISVADFAILLAQGGEAWAAVELPL